MNTNGNPPLGISAAGQFAMLRPLPDFSIVNMAAVAIRTNEFPSLYLGFGTAQGTNVGMAASLTNVPSENGNLFYGAYKLVQLTELHCKLNYVAGTNVFGWQRDGQGLDNEYPYGGSDAVIAGQSQLANNPIWTDSPDQIFGWPGRWVSKTDSFQDYLMFQHFSYNSIPVPMYLGTRGWSGSASTTGGLNFTLLSSNVQPPVVILTTQFPVWTSIVTNNASWDVTNLPPFIEN